MPAIAPDEQTARFRALDALAQLTQRIAHATREVELYDAALDALRAAIGARRAAILLYDAAGVMRFRAWREVSDAYRALAEGHSPWERNDHDPQVLVVENALSDPSLASLRPALEAENVRALAFIPLVASGELLGKFMVYWSEPHRASDVELDALRGIAERVALGLARLRAEEAMRASRDHLDAILTGIADGVTAQDLSGRLVFANPAAARLIGFDSVEQLLATPTASMIDHFELFDENGDLLSPQDLPGARALRGETPPPMLIRHGSLQGGANRWSTVSASPVRDLSGTVRLAINIFHDVTAEQEAHERERFLAAIGEMLASSLDYETTLKSVAQLAIPSLADWCRIDVVDPDGVARPLVVEHRDPEMVRRAEELMRRYASPPERSMIVRVLESGKSELIPVVTDEMLAASVENPEFLAFLHEIGLRSAMVIPLCARGRTLASLTLVGTSRRRPYHEGDVAFAEDVARRAALAIDNALLFRREEEARAEAETANRAKDEFLAMISHELRTPLTAVLGWSRMLTMMSVDARMLNDGLEAIARAAEAQARIVDDLLDVSRVVTGKMRLDVVTVRVRDVLDQALTAIRPAADAKRITIERRAAAEDVMVRGDVARLQQVFWNLLTNAVKFTPTFGHVEIFSERRDGSIVVRVRDSGSGVRPELLPHIFERFRQGDSGSTRASGGLGLGLAIAKSLIELHGGTIAAESDGDGKGSMFTVTLPIAHPDARHDTEPVAERRVLEGRRVLLVEDEADTRGFLRALLETSGAEVQAAAGVTEAVQMLDGWTAHAVISDIAMPGADGYALLRMLREGIAPSVRAMAVTAYGGDDDRDRALDAGFDAYMRKPIDPDCFLRAVASMIA